MPVNCKLRKGCNRKIHVKCTLPYFNKQKVTALSSAALQERETERSSNLATATQQVGDGDWLQSTLLAPLPMATNVVACQWKRAQGRSHSLTVVAPVSQVRDL